MELKDQGIIITDEQREKIYGPTGIDIGAEAPEEIALSVLSEIKAVLSDHNGTFLRARSEAIHLRLPVETAMKYEKKLRNCFACSRKFKQVGTTKASTPI